MRWPAFLRRRHWDRERALELEAYLEQETADNLARGMAPAEARTAARRKLGNPTRIREEIYLSNSLPLVDTAWRNLRYTLRQLRRSPVFTAAAVLSLALGIGATTAIFTLIDRILLRPLPVSQPNQLVRLGYRDHPGSFNMGGGTFSWPLYTALRDGTTVLSPFGRLRLSLSVSERDVTDRVDGELVTGNYFQVLGIPAALGRVFVPADDQTLGGHPLAVLSYDYWVDRFGSDPAVLGRTIRVNDVPLTIIGVSARGFDGVELGFHPGIRIPVTMKRPITGFFGDIFPPENKDALWLEVYGRLGPGIGREQAQAVINRLMPSFQAQVGIADTTARRASGPPQVELRSAAQGQSDIRQQFATPLIVLMALVGLVLLMASLNVANLLLARATTRRREIAVRLALGAARRHVVLQLLVESVVLAVSGGGAGLLFAAWTNRALLRLIPAGDSVLTLPTGPDLRILGFTALICFGTSLLFGLIPGFGATRVRLLPALKDAAEGGRSSSTSRNALVGLQVFFSVLLLVAAGLFARTLGKLRSLDFGFQTEHLLSFTADPSINGYRHERAVQFFQSVLNEVKAVPGVESAALGAIRLLNDDSWGNGITVEGYESAPGENTVQSFDMVSPGYFPTLGIPILQGREFTPADARSGHLLAVVNRDMARRYFGNSSPIGRRFRMGGPDGDPVEIIGLIGPTKYRGVRDTARRQVFLNFDQHPDPTMGVVYVRTRAGSSLFPQLRQAVRRIDAHVPLFAERTLEQQIDRSLATERLLATLASLFGLMATLLAAVGLYGIMAFTVTGRRKEIGLRLALGARAPALVSLVVRDVLRVVIAGALAAVPAAWLLSRYIESQLYGISPTDSITLLGVAGLLTAVVAAACVAPLRRALRVSPMVVLREE